MPAGTITTLHAQAHDSQRVNVFIDGAFAIGISLTTVAQEKLFVGKQLSNEEFARLEQSERAERALQMALRFIDQRPRSIAEIRERLLQREVEPELAEAAIERLQSLGLADDRTFARYWIENRQTFRPRGPNALRDELRRKGVDRTLVNDLLADDDLVGDDQEQALQLARASLHKYVNLKDRMQFTRKLGGFLQRRGFDFATIRPVIERLWNEIQSDEDNDTLEPDE